MPAQCLRSMFFFAGVLLMGVVEIAALPKVVKIGGLFDPKDKEQELAFKIAVDYFNTNRQRSQPRIIAEVENVNETDAFTATKKVCSLLEKGVAAVFGPQDPLTSLHVASICDEMEIPHIETRWVYKPNRDALSINLYPSADVLNEAYLTMIKSMGWKNFTLMYDSNEGIIRFHKILNTAERQNMTIQIYKLDENTPYRNVFWEVKTNLLKRQEEHMKIVLDVRRENMYEVLKHALQMGMLTEKQQYLITCLDLHTLDMQDFKYGKTHIVGFRIIKESANEYKQLVEAMDRYGYSKESHFGIRTETALMFDAVRMFILALQELNTGKEIEKFPSTSCRDGQVRNKDGTSLINYMKSSNMIGITGIVTFDGQGTRSYFDLDATLLTENGFIEFGLVHGHGQLFNQTANVILEDDAFERKKFIVTTIISHPYFMLKNSTDKLVGNDRYEGFCADLLIELSRVLHFQYEIRMRNDTEYGERSANSRWTGMIGELMDGTADMAVAGLSISSKREEVVEFTMPFINTGISIMFRKPTTKIHSLFSFLSPFSLEVWVLLMAVYFVSSLFLYVIGRLSPYEWINPHPCRQDDIVVENAFTLRNSLWFMIGSLMQEGSELEPIASSTRIAVSYWSFFTLILVSSYTANLAAFLTVEKAVYPFNNVEELSNQKEIKYGCINSGSTKIFFQESKAELYKKMWDAMSAYPDNIVQNSAIAMEKVKKGNYAFFTEAANIQYVTERECNFTQIGGLLDNKGYGIALQKGERELSQWLSSGILQLQEGGVLHTLQERWWKQKGGGKCVDQSKSSVKELTLTNVGGVFVVLIFGLGVSVVLAVVEFRWKSSQWENPNKDSFWVRMKKEIIFAFSFDIATKPVPQPKKTQSTTASSANSRSSSHATT